MAKRNTVRAAWWLAAILAGVVLGGTGLLLVRLRPYWVAKYQGERADLRGARLPGAPLASANLWRANLQWSTLANADLKQAILAYADLTGANLRGANLQGAYLYGTGLHGADLRGADLRGAKLAERYLGCKYLPGAEIGGACFDRHTRWPDGFDPKKHGAVRITGNQPEPAAAGPEADER